MPNRLTDTTIWKKQKWFKKLPPLYKLAWKYLTDECDHAGFWKVDLSELLDDLGLDDFDFDDFLLTCNKDYDKRTGKGIHRQRIMKINDTEVWLTGFIQFQYGKKSGKLVISFNATKSAIELLIERNLYTLAIDSKYICIEKWQPSPSHQQAAGDTDYQQEAAAGVYEQEAPNSISISKGISNVLPLVVLSKEESTIIEEEQKSKFSNYPTHENLQIELPEIYINKIIELYKINKNLSKSVGQVKTEFEFFKVQTFTGKNFYKSLPDIFSHFMNIIKKSQNGQQPYSASSNGIKPSRVEALRKF